MQSFEKLDEYRTLVVLSHGVEYIVNTKYDDIKNIILDFYSINNQDLNHVQDHNNIEIESDQYLSQTYSDQEKL